MKAEDKAYIQRMNDDVERNREMKMKLRDSDWHFLVYEGEHTRIHMRCPDRQHTVTLTPAEALSTGCRICALMDAPTETVSLARFKKDVELQDKEHLRSLKKTATKMRQRGQAPKYYIN